MRHATNFQAAFPILLIWDWEELEADLISMAETEASKVMVVHLVGALKAQAPMLGRRGVLRELGFIVLALIDPSFPEASTS